MHTSEVTFIPLPSSPHLHVPEGFRGRSLSQNSCGHSSLFCCSLFPLSPAPSSSPVGIIVSNVTSRDFSTQWLPPVPSGRNGVIRGYTVVLTNEVTGLTASLALGANETSLGFWDLHPAYTYILSIAALTVSQGPFSDPTRVLMAEDGKYMHANLKCSLI